MTAIDDEQAAILADLDAVHRVELVRARIRRILRRTAPVLDELAVFVEFGDARAAVTVADEERAIRQPVDVGRSIEQLAGVASALARRPKPHHELAVVGELPDLVQLIID